LSGLLSTMPRPASACYGSRRAGIETSRRSSATQPRSPLGMDHRVWRLGQRSQARAAVQGAFLAHFGSDPCRGYRAVSRIGHDPRHRARLCQKDGQRLRREGVRNHRGYPDRLREVDGIPLLRIHVSPQRGQNRRSLARSWCFCTATGWGRLVRFGSSRLMASMPLRDRLKTADAISIRLGIQKTAIVRFAPASRMH
jgi:hypothetical protein